VCMQESVTGLVNSYKQMGQVASKAFLEILSQSRDAKHSIRLLYFMRCVIGKERRNDLQKAAYLL
jgi:hypothetical protein